MKKKLSLDRYPIGPKNMLLRASMLSALGLMAGQSMAQNSVLEEILVTARKFEENLQTTPIAVSAFTEEALERRQIQTTEDLGAITPNLQFAAHGPLTGSNSAAQVFIRGIGQSDGSGGIDPGVGLYIDDVYMGRSVGGIMEFRDIANVQVLRGPQGTLFGRNTIGGAVLLTTRAPGDEFAGDVKLGIGDEGLFEFFGGVDLPLSDGIAARISYGTRTRDGYVTRVTDGIDLGNEDSWTLNASLHMDLSDTVNLVLRADVSEADENGSPFVTAALNENAAFPAYQSVLAGCPGATFPPPSVPVDLVDPRCANDATWDLGKYTSAGTAPAKSQTDSNGFSASLTLDLSDSLSFKSVTALRSLEWLGARDADNTPFNIISTVYESEQEQLSQEFQLLFNGDTYNGVAGLFYFDEEINDLLRVPIGPPGPPAGVYVLDYQKADLTNKSWAAFSQWNFDLSDVLSVSAGIRYTDEVKEMYLVSWNAGGFPLPVDPLPILTGIPTDVGGGLFIVPGPHENSFSKTTGSLSLQYDVSDTTMMYGSISQGFKSGGFNQRYNVATDNNLPTPFDSEEATSLEFGVKSDISDNLRLNAALFTTDYKNMQLTYRVGIVPLLFNAGKSSISGAELEMTYATDHDLIIEGGLGYLNDKIDEVAVIDFTVNGAPANATLGPDNDLPFTPELQASFSISKGFSIASDYVLTPRLNMSWTDEHYFDTGNTEEIKAEAASVVDFSLDMSSEGGNWGVVIAVDNLTDSDHAVAGNSSLTSGSGYAEVIHVRPRNYSFTVKYDF